jgi:hypothetical protein
MRKFGNYVELDTNLIGVIDQKKKKILRDKNDDLIFCHLMITFNYFHLNNILTEYSIEL